ncbi:MAG: NAD-dependent epimerase/dehydratase family protein [Rhodobacteraceae bacterium]|nr:NAD-dependent epimerase/dehydratase family protein [Paracoccaceae bacterium]
MTRPVLVLGATGLFGGHIARRLIGAGHPVILSGRSRAALQAFAAAHGGIPLPFDRDDAEAAAAALATARPFAVIDAAGPFQAYGPDPYRFARQVLEGGAHYLDLADAADFVAGIGALDALARARGLVALSGASSTPALSAAAADALAEGLDRIEAVEAAILPGNRTDRGLSVIRAILAQVGQPYRLWRGGRWQTVHGWDDTRMIAFRAGGHALTRPGALNETPPLPRPHSGVPRGAGTAGDAPRPVAGALARAAGAECGWASCAASPPSRAPRSARPRSSRGSAATGEA